jgi:hypothetical protein
MLALSSPLRSRPWWADGGSGPRPGARRVGVGGSSAVQTEVSPPERIVGGVVGSLPARSGAVPQARAGVRSPGLRRLGAYQHWPRPGLALHARLAGSAMAARREGDPSRLTSPRAICVPSAADSEGHWRSRTVTRVTLSCADFSIGARQHEW